MLFQNMTSLVDGHLLLEGWKVSVDGYAAEVVNEGEVFWYVSCSPVAEEVIQNTLVSSCNKGENQYKYINSILYLICMYLQF